MANNGFGTGGFAANDYEALARQYWDSWSAMMRKAAESAPTGMPGMAGMPGMQGIPGMGMPGMAGMPGMGSMPGMGGGAGATMPGWNEAVAWWSQLAKGGGGVPGANEAIDRFNSQARGWFAQMQQVAAQLAGKDASASEIAQAWKNALGGLGGNPFAEMFRGMQGPGQHGFAQWVEQAAPYLQGFEQWQRQGQSMLGQPAFGFTREHQQRWQQLAQAQADYQQHSQAYNALMAEAAQSAFARFEAKLTERSAPGRQLESARALFDLWIDAAEESYAEIALSPRFRDAYGAMVNAQMRLRGALQREIEQASELLGMPTRTEVDAVHRKIVQLERELRRLRDAAGADPGPGSAATGNPRQSAARATPARPVKAAPPRHAATPAATPGPRPPAKAATRAAAKRPASAKTASAPAARKPVASSKPASRTAAKPAPARKRVTAAKRIR